MREYQCTNCERKVTELLSLTNKKEAIKCSSCGSTYMKITTKDSEKVPKKGMGPKEKT